MYTDYIQKFYPITNRDYLKFGIPKGKISNILSLPAVHESGKFSLSEFKFWQFLEILEEIRPLSGRYFVWQTIHSHACSSRCQTKHYNKNYNISNVSRSYISTFAGSQICLVNQNRSPNINWCAYKQYQWPAYLTYFCSEDFVVQQIQLLSLLRTVLFGCKCNHLSLIDCLIYFHYIRLNISGFKPSKLPSIPLSSWNLTSRPCDKSGSNLIKYWSA
jgi:hypothetical protein